MKNPTNLFQLRYWGCNVIPSRRWDGVALERKEKASLARMAILWPTQEDTEDRSKWRRREMMLRHMTQSQLPVFTGKVQQKPGDAFF